MQPTSSQLSPRCRLREAPLLPFPTPPPLVEPPLALLLLLLLLLLLPVLSSFRCMDIRPADSDSVAAVPPSPLPDCWSAITNMGPQYRFSTGIPAIILQVDTPNIEAF